ncbi:hypothetical protein BU17DRAFT_72257 [Hysterangium stoloniferum]|nr:hypothetical protein BU17DRAFT_72257 [Hysterangium stoloniferum]
MDSNLRFMTSETELRLMNPSKPLWSIGVDLAYWWPPLNTRQGREYGDAQLYQLYIFRSNTLTAGEIIDLIEPILWEPQQAFADQSINILTSLAEREVFRTMVVTNHIGDKLVTWLESNDQTLRETATTLEAPLGKYALIKEDELQAGSAGSDGPPVIVEERSTSGVDTESGQRGRKRPTTIV